MAKECMLSTGIKLPLGGLPRNSVVRMTDRQDMTSAVYCGCKATNQTNNPTMFTHGHVPISAVQLSRPYSVSIAVRLFLDSVSLSVLAMNLPVSVGHTIGLRCGPQR